MVEKLLIVSKRLCLYLLIVAIALPISLIFAGRASAAEKLLPPDASKIILKQNPQGQNDLIFGLPGAARGESTIEVSADKAFQTIIGRVEAPADGSIPTISLGDNVASVFYLRATYQKNISPQINLLNDITPPVIKGLDNLKEASYARGQSIVARFSAEAGLEVTANIGVLDESFPAKIKAGYVDGGLLEVRTPKLTNALIAGRHLIRVSAKDSAGNIAIGEIPVSLLALPRPEIVYIKVDNYGSIYPTWQPMKNAKQYKVEWREIGAEGLSKIVDGRYTATKISGLNSGTDYEVKITTIYFDGGVSPSSKSVVKTLGEKPAKMVLGDSETKTAPKITPAIGGGTSTAKTAQKQVEAQETTKPAPAAKEEETAKGGWNRLLVALSILIIAAGIAVGGYYGYEWLQAKSKDTGTSSKERW